jgi:broad specificity phosphatase PhoE
MPTNVATRPSKSLLRRARWAGAAAKRPLQRSEAHVNSLPQLYLIRHGETAWTLSGQHTGITEPPLTEHGQSQARKLRSRLQEIGFSHVLVSPRLRAQQTCELAGLAAESRIEPDLTEWNYGEYEGLRSVDIRRDRPGWSVWDNGSDTARAARGRRRRGGPSRSMPDASRDRAAAAG